MLDAKKSMQHIPKKIKEFIGSRSYSRDDIGKSDSLVYTFEDMVLKIEKQCDSSDNEYRMMQWLAGKLPVPEIICRESVEGVNYLLMTKMTGKMACDDWYLSHFEELVGLLAEGLKMLWGVDVTDCPYINSIEQKLTAARYRVENHLIDLDDVEPETFGEGGFQSPEQLLNWLSENRPKEELVFSHGDYCLPNVFLEGDSVQGFIDLGNAGIADKWQDIALCYRSLKHNMDGIYDGRKHGEYNADLLFEKLGVEPDFEKIRYFILLDELF